MWLEDEGPEQRKPWGGRGRPQPRPEMVFIDEREIRGQHGGDRIFGSFEESGAVSLGGNSGMLACFLCSLWLQTQSWTPEQGETLETGLALQAGLRSLGCAGGTSCLTVMAHPRRDAGRPLAVGPAPALTLRGRSQDHTSVPPLCFWQSHQT